MMKDNDWMDSMVHSLTLRYILLLGLLFFAPQVDLWSQNCAGPELKSECHCGDPNCQCGCRCGDPDCPCGCNSGSACNCQKKRGERPLPSFAAAQEYEYPYDFNGEEGNQEFDDCLCDQGYRTPYRPAKLCPWHGGTCVVDTTEPYDCSLPCQGFEHCAIDPDPCKFYTKGEWFPEKPPLFRPFFADPRQITASVGWRFNDRALTKNIIPVSYFDTVPIYRWGDVWPWHGKLQIDIEGALWACFDPCTDSAPLMNADYYIGLPITYAIDYWSFRFRVFHISSHLGDEFLLNHPGFDRRNPSAEYADLFASYELTRDLRLYGGLGYIIQYDDSFRFSRLYAEWGAELRLQSLGYRDSYNCVYGLPIFGMHFRWRHDFTHHLDYTYVLGYEWGKLIGLRHRYRLFMEYHDGYSCEGQFYRHFTNYFSIRFSWGF